MRQIQNALKLQNLFLTVIYLIVQLINEEKKSISFHFDSPEKKKSQKINDRKESYLFCNKMEICKKKSSLTGSRQERF